MSIPDSGCKISCRIQSLWFLLPGLFRKGRNFDTRFLATESESESNLRLLCNRHAGAALRLVWGSGSVLLVVLVVGHWDIVSKTTGVTSWQLVTPIKPSNEVGVNMWIKFRFVPLGRRSSGPGGTGALGFWNCPLLSGSRWLPAREMACIQVQELVQVGCHRDAGESR